MAMTMTQMALRRTCKLLIRSSHHNLLLRQVYCDAIEAEPLQHRFEISEGNTVVACESPGVDRDWSSHFQTTIVFDSPESVKKWLLEKAREVHMTIIVGRSDFSKGRSPRIFYVCERSGAYKKARPSQGELVKKTGTKSRKLKKTGTKKCECPFKIKMTNQSNDGDHWVVEVICGRHNHMLTPLIQGHACHAKLTPQEKEFFIDLSKGGIKPKAALSILRERNPNCSTSLQTLYNVKKKANKEKVDRTVLQQMMTLGDQRDYIMLDRRDVDTDVMSMDTKSAAAQLRSSGLLQTQGLIGGKWTDAYDGKTIEVFDPATGDVIVNVSCMGRKETHDAISSANDAFKAWSRLTANERSKYLRKWYDLLISHREELAMLITLEGGKPLKEAIGEVNYGASFIEFYAEEAKRVYGDIIPPTLADRRLFVLKQPVGVVGAITPWNFPLAMITRKVGPALACGCTVVIKPSELTPLTALAAAELSLQAGIPPGVVNVVMGNAPEIGDSLIESTQVRKITFTGSTAVGKKLMAGAAATVKKVSLELGGNAPCIIFDDADIDVAVKGSIAAKFRNSGQTCVCANRILVQEGIYEKFANSFASAVQNLQVGNGFMDGVTQGPLINEAAVQKVESFLQDAVSKGAKITVGGKRHSLGMTFYEPTVVSDVNSTMLLSREEAFGPIAPVLRFKTEEEAIQMANDTNAGLAAYIFTTNVQRSWRVAEALEYGMVGVNEGLISTEVAPFGGVKQSGLGREGSKYGMDEYQEIKYVCLGNLNSA